MKVTFKQYHDFINKYFTTFARHERFGQAFINEFFTGDMKNPELFYTDSFEKARDIIVQNYVNWEG